MTLSVTFQHPELRLLVSMVEHPGYTSMHKLQLCAMGELTGVFILDLITHQFNPSAQTAFTVQKNIIHQLTTMLATFRNVASTSAIIKVSGHQYRWLAGGHYMEIGHF